MQLSPISWDRVPEILKVIRDKSLPHSVTAYNKLNGQMELWNKFKAPEAFVLTPSGQVDEFATFALIIPAHRFEIHAHTLHNDLEMFAKALLESAHIDWTLSPTLSCVRDTLYPVVEYIEKMLPNHRRENDFTRSFHMKRELALQLDDRVPKDREDEVVIEPLKEEHAEFVNRLWPHGGTPESFIEVRDYIRYRPSFGIFKKDTRELVAWTLYGEYGGPAILQVMQNHKRKGYGEMAMRAVTKITAEMGMDPHAFITPHNEASMGLFRKLGYEEKYPGNWAYFIYQKKP